jgi:hypothetical protein
LAQRLRFTFKKEVLEVEQANCVSRTHSGCVSALRSRDPRVRHARQQRV